MKIKLFTCLSRCGGNWDPDVESGFALPGDTGLHVAPCSNLMKPAQEEGSQIEGNGTNRAGGHWVSVVKETVFLTFILIRKTTVCFIIINWEPPVDESSCITI
jgi:hypothetical protein